MVDDNGGGAARWLGRLRTAAVDLVRGVPLEEDAEQVFQRERRELNVDRLRMVAPVLMLVHVGSLAIYWPRWDAIAPLREFRLSICAIHLVMMSLLVAAYAAVRWGAKNARLVAVVPDLFALVYILFGAALSANAQRLNGNQNSYVVAVLAAMVVFRQQGTRAALAVAGGLATYLAGVWLLQPEDEKRLVAVGPAVAVTVLGYVVSRANSAAMRRAIAARLTIEAQRAELAQNKRSLEEINRGLGQRVEAQVDEIVTRVREIEQLNAELRVKVVDRSRELLRALKTLERPLSGEALAVGSLFAGRVEVLGLLARGGMGEVYRGHDRVTLREVALKLLRPDISPSANGLARFVSEAEAAAAVDHPAVVRALHVDVSPQGRVYQIMEYVEGRTLEHDIERGSFDGGTTARIGSVVCGALAAAHARGVVHRDVKPSNVMLTDEAPGARLMDFGVSKITREDEEGTRMTADHHVLGTPLYMAPEQILSPQTVGPSADVYSLGAMLFEMLVGQPPFPASDVRSVLVSQMSSPAPRLADWVSVPVAMADLVDRMLAKAPEDRPSAEDARDALRRIADAEGAPVAERIHGPTRVRDEATTASAERRIDPKAQALGTAKTVASG